jgi:hypothetical protein
MIAREKEKTFGILLNGDKNPACRQAGMNGASQLQLNSSPERSGRLTPKNYISINVSLRLNNFFSVPVDDNRLQFGPAHQYLVFWRAGWY